MEEELTKEQLKKGIETYQELFLWEKDKADLYERKCERLKEEIEKWKELFHWEKNEVDLCEKRNEKLEEEVELLRDITENYRELLKDKELIK